MKRLKNKMQIEKSIITWSTTLLVISLLIASCNNRPKNNVYIEADETIDSGDKIIKNAVVDADGNSYDAVRLGSQTWMKSNLRYKGDLPEYSGDIRHDAACYFESVDGEIFYNGRAVLQGVCPPGWYVPSERDWIILEQYCMTTPEYKCGNSDTYIAKALADKYGWKQYTHPNPEDYCNIAYNPLTTNNATNFSARGEGMVNGYNDGDYRVSYDGERAYFWSSDFYDDSYEELRFRSLWFTEPILIISEIYNLSEYWTVNINSYEIDNKGLSIRCIKE